MKEKNNNKKIKISFFGGTEEVTGSNYLLEIDGDDSSGRGKTRILADCGLFQGSRVAEEKNSDPFPYKPSSVDALLVTHAHLDHVGRIPKLVKEGFKGKIYSTYPTKDFAKLMLIDSLGVLEKEAKRHNDTRPIYQEEDVEKAMSLWEAKNYRESFEIGGVNILFKDAGHILGSAIIEITDSKRKESGAKKKKLVFTGDLGNSPEPLINSTEAVNDASFMIIESTYGDRLHEDYSQADLKLERTIEEIVKKKGTLMIPAFSLERTQRILYQINDLVENGRIPKIKIFLDSPLSIKATEVYKKYINLYNTEAKNSILKGDDLFDFPGLILTMEAEESKKINEIAPPKIIIAGSGMCNGGRIVHHLKNYLPSKNNTLLFVSYMAVGSLGRLLHDGEKLVNIMGEKIPVEAEIEKIGGYSSHADLNGLLEFAANSADSLEKVFVTHGELKSSSFLAQRLRDYLGVAAIAPAYGETREIEI
ncbi:MAG: hypothetical protein UX11_C0033G0003 [Candidatus Collierbacteria bacterium GW2011_GWC2_45_40]|nr:MAG: hypothetical protein UX11_C0033G0003 [Candidatus Collierbacteria bacterium GW2011_GWC2_45_40]